MLAATAIAQTQVSTSELNFQEVSVSTVSIHDPSIVCHNGQYTIWGSHMGVATSNDLIKWTGTSVNNNTFRKLAKQGATTGTACGFADAFNTQQVTKVRNYKGEEVDFPNFDAEKYSARYAANKSTWVNGNMWAPDIIYNETMKKWCMYLSLNGDHWSSIIILLTASSPTGPFTYQGPIVMSGFHGQTIDGVKCAAIGETDYEIATGEKTFNSRYTQKNNGTFWPNCIDPCVFFDEEGELWMTYGSWSGGIFMLKLDKETGLRDYPYTYASDYTSAGASGVSDPYFGKKIAGGYYVSGEGSYIQHIGKYYYLFMSYGFFAPGGYEADGKTARGGGYDMRIFRSEKPEGPYLDASGTPATFTAYRMNYGANPNDSRGMRLMSAYNNWGPVQTIGERSQGHNSACTDSQGRSFVVYHTKFNDGSVGHQVRTHQLFTNKNGWLVAAPFHFCGETQNDESMARGCQWERSMLLGEYHLLIHPTKQDFDKMEEATPIIITLNENGSVTGDKTGTWTLEEGTSFLSLKLAGVTYNGVFCKNQVNGATERSFRGVEAEAICFTAVCDSKGSNMGVPVWGYKLHPISALAYNYTKNKDIFTSNVKQGASYGNHIRLQFDATDNVNLTWTSSEPTVISETGKYNPAGLTENLPVTLTARMDCGDYYWEQAYNVKAKAEGEFSGDCQTGLMAYYTFDGKPTYNLMQENDPDRITFNKVGSGKIPTLESDYERMGQYVHQYFGAMGQNSYSRMPNPLYGLQEEGKEVKGLTVSAWVKRTDDNAWDALWSFYNSTIANTASSPRLYLTGNSYIGYNDGADNWFDINKPDPHYTNIPVGEWALVTVTVGPENGIRLYVNGSVKAFKTFDTSYNAGSSTLNNKIKALPIQEILQKVGTMKYFNLGFGSFWGSADAMFDDLLIYNRELSASDVSALKMLCNRVYDFSKPGTTGIGDILAGDILPGDETTGTYYDLSGRRIASPVTKGIYIKNGRKVIR